MPLVPLKFKAGIVKDITEYASGKGGFYVDGNLVRFRNGYPTKIGGWVKETYSGLNPDGTVSTQPSTVTGSPKQILAWRANSDGSDRIAIATHNHIYVIKDSVYHDITPLRKTTSNLSNPLATTDGSSVGTLQTAIRALGTVDSVNLSTATATATKLGVALGNVVS